MRTDIIDHSQTVGTPQSPPGEHPFNTLVVSRVLTIDHGVGNPDPTPVGLTGMKDLLKLRPRQTVTLQDENGAAVDQVIDYADGAVTGAHLAANTSPEQVLTLLKPAASDDPHEPGLVVRLGYEIEGLNALRLAVASGAELPSNPGELLTGEEGRMRAWLDALLKFERTLFPARYQ
jgi:hypothetical protein